MNLETLPFRADLAAYQEQAAHLLAGHRDGDLEALQLIHRTHPRFLDAKIPWLPLDVPESEIGGAAFDLDDAQLALARWYDFQGWAALAEHAEAVSREDSGVFRFESAVEAVVHGDLASLRDLVRRNPELVRERSARRTHFDPPTHRATLLHYIAANGVENHRQKTPANIVEVTRVLLEAGSEVDATADLYGGPCTTMSLLASSAHPAKAGAQVALIELLLDFGASLEGIGTTRWRSPLMSALAFSYTEAAEALARRGARADRLAAAAGLGRLEDAARLLAAADGEERHRALALAAQLGRVEIVRLLLDAGEDPNRYNPEGLHAHSTPLHQAALAGHRAVVALLIERGARLDMRDLIYQGAPLGWAQHASQTEIADLLRAHAG